MKKLLLLIITFACHVLPSSGSTGEKVNATVLRDETVFTIKSEKLAIETNEYEVIIHNRYADLAKQVRLHYNEFAEIKNAEATLYTLDGERIKKIKLKDFEDYGIGLNNTASDSRLKFYEPNLKSYPYVLRVSTEIHKTGSLHYPVWNPQQEKNMHIQKASFTVHDYSGNGIQYQSYQLAEPRVRNLADAKLYRWEVSDLKPFEFEEYNYSWEEYTPMLYTAPKSFEMEGIHGDMSSWESFGDWIAKLNTNKADLSSLDLASVDALVGKAKSDKEKIRLVYDYLQNNTRYVSIQLGIGGWQPFEASFVHENKYGDCKALSNYTKALLDRYGIKSYYTLIRAGKYKAEVQEDFPNAHFNHAIVTVPIEHDTLFLECTSQTNPFGYMGTWTSNRKALVIEEGRSKLISTKKYQAQENVQTTTVEVDLIKEGNTSIKFSRDYAGLEIDNHNFQSLYWSDSKEFKEWVRNNHDWGGEDISMLQLDTLVEQEVPSAGYSVNFNSNKEFNSMGTRKFVSPDRYINSYLANVPNKERKTPIEVRYGYVQYDTITYNLDEYYVLEKNLELKEIETEYGSYSRELISSGTKLKYVRTFRLNDGKYSVEHYEDFRKFVQSVRSADKERFVLLNKT